MSDIDLEPIVKQMNKIDSAAYNVVYNLLSTKFNIEKQYMGFKILLESNSPMVTGNWKFYIRKKYMTVLRDTIIHNYKRIKENLFQKLKEALEPALSGKSREIKLVFERVINELETDFNKTYPGEADLQVGGKRTKRRRKKMPKTRKHSLKKK